jgi:signal transduction histidine kinase
MTALLVGLAGLVLLVFGLGVRKVSLLNAERQAVQLVERTEQRFSQKLDQVEGLGSLLSRLWAEGQFDPTQGFIPDPILVQAGSLPSFAGLIVARADGRTSILVRQGDHWTLQRITPLGGGRSREEHDEWTPSEDRLLKRVTHEIEWDARNRPWFRQAAGRKEASWTSVYPSADGRTPCISFTVPVRDGKGRLLGVVAMDYAVQALGELLGDSLPTPGSEALFVDQAGTILASTSRKIAELAPLGLEALPRLPHPQYPGFSAAFARMHDSDRTHKVEVMENGGERMILLLENKGRHGFGWVSMMSIPQSDLAPSPWNGALAHLSMLLVFFGLATWQITRVAGRMVGPLTELAQRAQQPPASLEPRPPASDIREFRMLEESLRRGWEQQTERQLLREQLLHLERVQLAGTLTSGLAHDLGNLLSAARLSLDLAEDYQIAPDPDRDRHLEAAQQALDRASRLVGSMLEFCRSVESERQAFDLGGSMRRLQPILTALLGRPISLELDARETWVQGNEIQLEQVVVNLVLNARDALGGSGRVAVRVQPAGAGLARLEVEDNGPGIPHALLPRIFEPFFTTKPSGRGTGLGLAMAQHIALEHGGELKARNREGGGALFTLTLPGVPPPGGNQA